ncbi:formate dehydrogenase subunit gamma [Halarcobacter sp.]|uniref:formate dehydrogenase subunit gamma n=1 Tax=Halarcobacter sp. TaxID=2321133 RepID=UPI0029F5540E|nr:formate dehydrogenase subunit gamma [Halarcobacter sp.]
MKTKYIILALVTLSALAFGANADSAIWGKDLVPNILGYDQEGTLQLGKWFTVLQGKYFSIAFLAILFGVPGVFLLHYLVIGPKVFSHDRKKIKVFNLFHRLIHWIAGFSFLVLIPTGFVMIFGTTFGGGEFVRVCKELHAISTPFFAIAVIPMLLMWFKEMLPTTDDIKWMMIMGGYLSKVKKPIPAGKFNAGQKMWFWLCTFGGILMILTGAVMYFQDFKIDIIVQWGISQIDLLRGSAIVHNVMGMAVAALFFTHVYMSMFAIKGAIHSMINGYKEEEEVEILHSTYYKKLKEEKKI